MTGRRSLPPVADPDDLDCQAMCADCPWESYARNALGQANQHARRTGHQVRVEQTISVTYNRRDGTPNRYT